MSSYVTHFIDAIRKHVCTVYIPLHNVAPSKIDGQGYQLNYCKFLLHVMSACLDKRRIGQRAEVAG